MLLDTSRRFVNLRLLPYLRKIGFLYNIWWGKSIDLQNSQAKGPGVAWTVESALKELNKEPLLGRNYNNGQKMFLLVCAWLAIALRRRRRNWSRPNKPAKRSDYKSILESTIHPNMVVLNNSSSMNSSWKMDHCYGSGSRPRKWWILIWIQDWIH